MGYDAYDSTNARSREKAAQAATDQVKAYRERTDSEDKNARADRLVEVRMRSVELAFRMYKEDPQVFGFDDVLSLADRVAKFVADGEPVQDGAAEFRFYGRK